MKKRITPAAFGIIGLGRFGLALVECLSKAEKEVIAVDKDDSRVKEARRFTDYAFVVESMERETLEEVGIQNCDTVVICIGEQMDISILATMIVLNLGVPHVIAKASSPIHGEVLKRLGAAVVYPEWDMAVRLGKKMVYDNFLDSITLTPISLSVTDKLIGVSIQEANTRQKYKLNIIAIEHDHRTDVDFLSQYCFREGDIISVIGKIDNIERFEKDIQNE